MLELESRLLRLLKLVESITLEENITYCANEILSILEKSEDINYRAREFSSTANVECDRPQYSLYRHVIRAIVSAARSNRLKTHRCAQKILEVLRPYVSRRIFDELETDAMERLCVAWTVLTFHDIPHKGTKDEGQAQRIIR